MGNGWEKDFDDMFLWDTVNEGPSQKKRGEGSREHSHSQSNPFNTINEDAEKQMQLWKEEHQFIEEKVKKYSNR